MTHRITAILAILLLGACAAPGPVLDTTNPSFVGDMPVDFSGSWERDYSRGDDVRGTLNSIFRAQQRQNQQQSQFPGGPRATPSLSPRDGNALVALARLVDEITRPDVLTITQNDFEIRVARKDDFDLSCSFFDGVAQGTDSAYGTEVCSWDGESLISHLVLPGGLTITSRFTMSADGNYLRVITTAKSSATRTPFTQHRYYIRFEAPPNAFNCIETLSMKRVCSTGEVAP
ncbi:MAG: hypothetical protein QNI96_14545 [Woeseiaceae bacterium]|nr:hypothetical protein [Woeseiaceae bacterium]